MPPAPSPPHAAALAELAQVAQDAAAAEAVAAFAAQGINAIVLKGAAIADRLYDSPGARRYNDTDLLVDPARHGDAERTLAALGYADPLAGIPDFQAVHASTWHRGPTTIDLHRTVLLSGRDPATTWAALSAETRPLTLGGRPVRALGDAALALVIAAHVVQHGPAAQPRTDLVRALVVLDRPVWDRTCDLAQRLAMEEVLGVGLREVPEGQALADALELPEQASPEIALRLRGFQPLAGAFPQLAELRSPAKLAHFIFEELTPPPAFIRHWWPYARRGRAALALGYLYRPFWLARHTPAAFVTWRATTRPERIQPTLGDLRAALWTWRAGIRVRRQLRAGGLEAVALPRVPRVDSGAIRGLAAVDHRMRLSCLERSLVRQRWHAAHGSPRDVVIGVGRPGEDFGAHAWLEGDPPTESDGFTAMLRRPA
jgi:hypothetical protein